MTTLDYDAFTAQVVQQRLKAIVEEMATMLLRTSGSPVLTEAQDFCTAVFDANGDHVAFSGYVVAHLGSSLLGVQAVLREYGLDDIHRGDAFVCNDAYTAGAIHQGDVGVICPVFHGDELVGWSFSNAHVLDVGGMSPGGWAPEAYDVFSEALSLPAIRIAERGRMLRDIQRIITKNVRMPVPVINDIKSLIVANNTAERRIGELLDRYGRETYERYVAVNRQLADRLIRGRVATIPDGVYRATEWVEYDGHGTAGLHPVEVAVTVGGDSLTVDLSGSAVQCDGFVNAGPGAVIGCCQGVMAMMLGCDAPVNAGMFDPLTIEFGAEGTIVNPIPPAPTSCGHMETGGKAGKALSEALTKACQLSSDPWVRNRVAGIGHNCWPGNAWIGLDQFGEYTAFPVFDCGSGGIGAQATGDGLDIGAFEMQLNNGIPEVETNEGVYPMLYLYRQLHVDSGGPGYHRGGQGMDFAWTPYNGVGLLGTMENACGQMPAHGTLGGFPGATSRFEGALGYDVHAFAGEQGRMPGPADVEGYQPFRNHQAGAQVPAGGVFHQITGGGSGIGDPLLRPPTRVARDVADGYITPTMAAVAYGVVIDDGVVDEEATAARRAERRAERIGRTPERAVDERRRFAPALTLADGRVGCGVCDTDLGDAVDGGFKAAAVETTADLAAVMDLAGMLLQPLDGWDRRLVSWACPGCGSMLQTEVQA